MKRLGDSGPRSDNIPDLPADQRLAKERASQDLQLREEREMLDAALADDPADVSQVHAVLRELREKIRRRRVVADGTSQTDRYATDEAMRDERATVRAPHGAPPELWSVLAEIDVIINASARLRLDRIDGPDLLVLADRIDRSSNRILDVVDELLRHNESA
jgi:hypothetical protein